MAKAMLHLVFGGELVDPQGTEFRDPENLDIVGIYPELCQGASRLEGGGAADGRQRAYALFHRPSAPAGRRASARAAPNRRRFAAERRVGRRARPVAAPLRRPGVPVGARLGALYIRLVNATTRWRVEGREHYDRLLAEGTGVIVVMWHGRLFMSPYWGDRNRRTVAMISNNQDGELITAIVGRFGIHAVRGSTYDRGKARDKGGLRAYVGARRELRRERAIIGMSPDGPRGPADARAAGRGAAGDRDALPGAARRLLDALGTGARQLGPLLPALPLRAGRADLGRAAAAAAGRRPGGGRALSAPDRGGADRDHRPGRCAVRPQPGAARTADRPDGRAG